MNKGFALAAAVSLYIAGSVALADTSVESSTVAEPSGTTSSTTVRHQENSPAPVIVAPASEPTLQKTKFKKERKGFFGKTKIKGETTTITP